MYWHTFLRRVANGRVCVHDLPPRRGKLTFEYISTFCTDSGRPLLSSREEVEAQRNLSSDMRIRFLCPCGAEVETRWEAFRAKKGTTSCVPCANRNTQEKTRAKHKGKHHFQTESFREHCIEVSRTRHGTDFFSQSPEMKKRNKETILRKYGVTHILHLPEVNAKQRATLREVLSRPAVKAKYRKTIMDRYGVPSLSFLSRRSSRAASEFFTAVFTSLPIEWRGHCYFAPHSREYNAWYEKQYYKYDFVHTALKKAIEFNGTRFHPRPEQKDDETGWCLYHPAKTVAQARAYEAHKLEALKARGFEVLIVWDTEVKHDRSACIDRCLRFLLGEDFVRLDQTHALGSHVLNELGAKSIKPTDV